MCLAEVGPKKILDLMNVPWLTRENVASHLQVDTLGFCCQVKLFIYFPSFMFLCAIHGDVEVSFFT